MEPLAFDTAINCGHKLCESADQAAALDRVRCPTALVAMTARAAEPRGLTVGTDTWSWCRSPSRAAHAWLASREPCLVRPSYTPTGLSGSHLGAVIVAHTAADDGVVVCYEADELDPVRHTGWSVIATGMARLVRDPDAITGYQQVLEPWGPAGWTM